MEDSYSVDFIKISNQSLHGKYKLPCCFIPHDSGEHFNSVPSELVVPPAAWKAAQGDLNIFLVVLFSTIGCVLGALIKLFSSQNPWP
jgi:membrane protein DedA with SNARE-associated domain